jgi:hypothetical protein
MDNKIAKTQDAATRAGHESDAAYAIQQLGDLLRIEAENGQPFESRHFVGIAIAIEHLARSLYHG